eukprot:GHVS01000780.1.p1 GENE.GHVS01000780.1~~GHVS01000780.1.p1  ORF type:complete len:953 (-),score=91.30 GHVS01000780.1:230-3088(-)
MENLQDLYSKGLSVGHRAALLLTWMKAQTEGALGTAVEEIGVQTMQTCLDLQSLRSVEKLHVLKNARIVGCTISGASTHCELLQEFSPDVAIVEEAAEILESMLIAALPPSIQQIALIGDHCQLRPVVEEYELRKINRFDVSMMERLFSYSPQSGLPYPRAQLGYQNRMRKELADIVKLFYPNLRTNESRVKDNLALSVVKSSFFFLEKDSYMEKKQPGGVSLTNDGEAEDIIKFIKRILSEDYKASQITVLSAYRGQCGLLHGLLTVNGYSEVVCKTIDMYQGDENDFILVSCVRSSKPGFLADRNRLIVATSRARCGTYFFGNGQLLRRVPEWNLVMQHMDAQGCTGSKMPVICPRHPQTLLALEGPCSEYCGVMRECGHVCFAPCHRVDKHPLCRIVMQHRCDAGHLTTRGCGQDPELIKCMNIVSFRFPECGHSGQKACFQHVTHMKCEKIVTATCSNCRNSMPRACHKANEDCSMDCRRQCVKTLSCGHKCGNECREKCSSVNDCEFCKKDRQNRLQERIVELESCALECTQQESLKEVACTAGHCPPTFPTTLSNLARHPVVGDLTDHDTRWFMLETAHSKRQFIEGHKKLHEGTDDLFLVYSAFDGNTPVEDVRQMLNRNESVFSLEKQKTPKRDVRHIDMHKQVEVDIAKTNYLLVCKCQLGRIHEGKLTDLAKDFDTIYDEDSRTYRLRVAQCIQPVWLVQSKFSHSKFPSYWLKRWKGCDKVRLEKLQEKKNLAISRTLMAAINRSLCNADCSGNDGGRTLWHLDRLNVTRIENRCLYQAYIVKQEEVKMRMKKARILDMREKLPNIFSDGRVCNPPNGVVLDTSINEVWLFHGCDVNVAKQNIAGEGFDPRLGSGVFGAGCYFADQACKSSQYNNNTRCLLICRVILGDQMIKTTKFGGRRPSMNTLTNEPYDSIYGVRGHNEFIVFDSNQVYPEYLVEWE